MKLIKKQIKTVSRGISGITLSKRGVITLSKKAIDAIGLKEGDGIEVYQDADAPTDWYVRPGEGLKLRSYNNIGLLTNSVAVTNDFFECFPEHATAKSARFLLSTEPISGGYYAIITRKAL